MAISFQEDEHGKIIIRAICDVCKKPIDDLARGYVLWDNNNKDESMLIIHKVYCDTHDKKYSCSMPLIYMLREAVKAIPRNKAYC